MRNRTEPEENTNQTVVGIGLKDIIAVSTPDAVHRMENPGKLPLTLIEVQTGSYFGEDDIIRYDDVYARGQGAKG